MITQDQKKQILELRGRDYSQEKIAKLLKISRSTVVRHSRQSNCPHEKLYECRCIRCTRIHILPESYIRLNCVECGQPLFLLRAVGKIPKRVHIP